MWMFYLRTTAVLFRLLPYNTYAWYERKNPILDPSVRTYVPLLLSSLEMDSWFHHFPSFLTMVFNFNLCVNMDCTEEFGIARK